MVSETSSAAGKERLNSWLFKDRDTLEKRFGMELERIQELYKSDDGREQLLRQMKEQDPSLNGNVDKALDQVHRNAEQLKKKEGFLMKMLKLPWRATKAVGRTIKKHPFLSIAAVIAAIIALLYFTGPLAPTAGHYGNVLIEQFKTVLGKVGVAIPEVSVEAAGEVAVTGEAASAEAAQLAAEALVSPGEAAAQTAEAIRVGTQAAGSTAAEAAATQLSPAAEGVLASPKAAEAVIQGAKEAGVTDPFQRILQGMSPE